jgi:ribosomal-protein-serine acetyltransferase
MALLPERIEGYGLLLRRWVVEDAPAIARAVAESADHLRPWMPWMAHHPLELGERRALIQGWERDWRRGGEVALGIFGGDEIVGSCGLRRRSEAGVLEIGYWVHARFVRQGIATRAARLLTDAAFSIDGIQAVEIRHDKANVASAGVPRRLGFELVREHPDPIKAPSEMGIECVWRCERLSATGTAEPRARAESGRR